MVILLEFDLIYTVIRIPSSYSDISEYEDEFDSWVCNTEECTVYENGHFRHYYVDDKTFIYWLTTYKLKNGETVEILIDHKPMPFDESVKVDKRFFF